MDKGLDFLSTPLPVWLFVLSYFVTGIQLNRIERRINEIRNATWR